MGVDAEGSRLAHRVPGAGEQDLVFLLGRPAHLSLMWGHPPFAEVCRRLASFSRRVLLDRLG